MTTGKLQIKVLMRHKINSALAERERGMGRGGEGKVEERERERGFLLHKGYS